MSGEAAGELLRRVFMSPATAAASPEESFTCPRCGMTSCNGNDARESYCGNCHDWTGQRQ